MTGEEERGRERVERAREFLKVYSRDGQTIIKSATFPLRLKPAGKLEGEHLFCIGCDILISVSVIS